MLKKISLIKNRPNEKKYIYAPNKWKPPKYCHHKQTPFLKRIFATNNKKLAMYGTAAKCEHWSQINHKIIRQKATKY